MEEPLRHVREEIGALVLYSMACHRLTRGSSTRPNARDVASRATEVLWATIQDTKGDWKEAKVAARALVIREYLPYMSPRIRRLLIESVREIRNPERALAVVVDALLTDASLASLGAELNKVDARDAARLFREVRRLAREPDHE
jgi:hypothetical protein